MKKFIRKLTALTLALCLVCACAITVSAESRYTSGTYNGQGYGTVDTCNANSFYSQTGSSSEYLLKTKVDFYFRTVVGGDIYVMQVESDPATTKMNSISGGKSSYIMSHIVGYHYVDGTLVQTVTANAS